MTDRTNQNDEEFIVDDAVDDVMAAYQELQGKAERGELPEPEYDGAGPISRTENRQEETPSEPRPQTGDRNRDPKGRYAPETATEAQRATQQPQAEKAATDQPEPSQDPSNAAPPPSWGVKAKTQWANLPAEVRAEIGKREGEVAQGFAALRDYKDLKPYAELATKHNTTIGKALDKYMAVDRLMNQDLGGGLAIAAESYGIGKDKMGEFFAGLAQRYGYQVSGSPSNGQPNVSSSEADPLMEVLKPVLEPLLQQVNELKQHNSQRVEADRNAKVSTLASEINRFAADPGNIYYANVESEIVRIFDKGLIEFSGNPAQDLKAAYEFAIWQNPETRAALIEKQVAEQKGTQRQQEQDAVARARQASRSMGGSRVPGTIYKEPTPDGGDSDDVEADVRRAMRAHSLA